MLILTALALIVACGSSATATPPPPTATQDAVAEPTAITEPAAVEEATVMNYAVKETGVFEGHPRFMSSPRVQYSAVSFVESLVAIQPDLSPGPLLATAWEISENGQIWTFKVRDDVEFHAKCGSSGDQSCGNLTIHDVLWNYKEWHEGSLNARAGIIGDFWVGKAGGSQTVIDEYTVEIDTGEPWLRERAFEFMRHLGGVSTTIVSMQQTQELVEAAGGSMSDTTTSEYEEGAKVASKNISATGPWEIESHDSGSVWRFRAVENHWRQTPYFGEFNIRSIPEEATRIASFQAGELDIMEMSFDSLDAVSAVEGTEIVAWPFATQAGLNVAINRQEIVDTIFSGFGAPLYMRDWMGHEAKADPRWTFEYDPDLARQLLEEAGYGPGNEFSITLAPAIRGRPGEVEACEAVAGYWEEVRINVDLQRIPYATIRPELITRTFQGATCHSLSGRLTPGIGASNYVAKSTFSYGTEHPWMEENITDLLGETNPVLVTEKERKVYGWMYDNAMASALYSVDGIWPVGKRLDPEWTPIDFSEVSSPSGFEYIKPRQ